MIQLIIIYRCKANICNKLLRNNEIRIVADGLFSICISIKCNVIMYMKIKNVNLFDYLRVYYDENIIIWVNAHIFYSLYFLFEIYSHIISCKIKF